MFIQSYQISSLQVAQAGCITVGYATCQQIRRERRLKANLPWAWSLACIYSRCCRFVLIFY